VAVEQVGVQPGQRAVVRVGPDLRAAERVGDFGAGKAGADRRGRHRRRSAQPEVQACGGDVGEVREVVRGDQRGAQPTAAHATAQTATGSVHERVDALHRLGEDRRGGDVARVEHRDAVDREVADDQAHLAAGRAGIGRGQGQRGGRAGEGRIGGEGVERVLAADVEQVAQMGLAAQILVRDRHGG
jgi:hypothetical protein